MHGKRHQCTNRTKPDERRRIVNTLKRTEIGIASMARGAQKRRRRRQTAWRGMSKRQKENMRYEFQINSENLCVVAANSVRSWEILCIAMFVFRLRAAPSAHFLELTSTNRNQLAVLLLLLLHGWLKCSLLFGSEKWMFRACLLHWPPAHSFDRTWKTCTKQWSDRKCGSVLFFSTWHNVHTMYKKNNKSNYTKAKGLQMNRTRVQTEIFHTFSTETSSLAGWLERERDRDSAIEQESQFRFTDANRNLNIYFSYKLEWMRKMYKNKHTNYTYTDRHTERERHTPKWNGTQEMNDWHLSKYERFHWECRMHLKRKCKQKIIYDVRAR